MRSKKYRNKKNQKDATMRFDGVQEVRRAEKREAESRTSRGREGSAGRATENSGRYERRRPSSKEAAYEEYLALRNNKKGQTYNQMQNREEYTNKEYDDVRRGSRGQGDQREVYKEPKKKKKVRLNKRIWRKRIQIIAIVLAILIGTMAVFAVTTLSKVGDVDIDKSQLGISSQAATNLKGYRNIALLGLDARNMKTDQGSRTDAIIIVSINKKTNDIKLMSIFRDTYLYIDEAHGFDKITNAHAYGGTMETLNTLNENMDLNIEEVAIVNWKSVADTVNALGGLEIDVRQSEIHEMNKYIKDTQKNIGGSKKLIKKPGKQTLNGNQAVTYARIRKDSANGDYRRNERMKIVLAAAFDKAKTAGPFKLNNIANNILPDIKTNISTMSMLGLMAKFPFYDIGSSVGWPFKVTGWTHNGVWYGPPVTLQSNVNNMYKKIFKQGNYTPSDKVKNYSQQISSQTGYY
ncbi:MAG: LCP family protein [Anaerovoracaceae bacterium]